MTDAKTLYISDLDGTLLNPNAELSEYTRDTLNQLTASGTHFTVATGRTIEAARKIMAGVTLNIPVVALNGALLYDIPRDTYLKICWLPAETVKQVIAVLQNFHIDTIMDEFKDGRLVSYYETLDSKPLRDFVAVRTARYGMIFRQASDFNAVPPGHIIYFSLADTYERVLPVYEALKLIPGINLTLMNDSYDRRFWYVEMYHAGASKKNGVRFLRETFGYEKIIGFGDNSNDLPMFEVCDVRVAVENATAEVKAAADFIALSHDRDGVAKWMRQQTDRRK